MARAEPPEKLKGIHPSWLSALRKQWPHILVEADGSKRLPLKAPADHEPVLPPDPDLVVAVLGLDGLGQPMDGRTVHRPERFAQITDCELGEPIQWAHLAALAGHPSGLFKGAPGRRVLLLNKADLAPILPTREQLAALPANLVLLGALEAPERGMVMVKGCRS
jgi:probable selenium-dependent hydroxylase accessory protein YqeC